MRVRVQGHGRAARPRWLRHAASATALVLAATLLPTLPASAQEVTASAPARVLGDVTHQRLTVRLPSGATARGDLIRFREDDPSVSLRPRLARGTVAGLQQMVPLSEERMRHGAVAGINGGYSLPRPPGAPNGLHVTDGRMVSGQAVNSYAGGAVPTGRGMVGIQAGGRMVMDELLVTLDLDRPQWPSPTARFDEVNRQIWPANVTRSGGAPWRPDGEMILYDDRFGTPIAVPGGATVVVVRGLEVQTSGRSEGDVVAVYNPAVDTTYTVSPDRYAIVAYGNRAEALADVWVGERLQVTTTITPLRTPADGWEQLRGGVAGGQLMVQAGVRRPGNEWTSYAALSESHSTNRNPRTAIGRTADGQGLLLTVDGRQVGWSAGMTVRELADTMIALGAVDAVNLDGGGSTTMTIGARITNRPSEVGRSVADGLFLHAPLPPPARALASACPDGAVPASSFVDVPGTTHEDAIACLAWWGVTQGVTDTTYAPALGVTRAQMASFIVRWIDGVGERGSAPALPAADGPLRFADVDPDSVHAPAIARLTAVGIIQGRSDTVYAPLTVMTRAQTASLLRRAVEYVTRAALPGSRDTFIDDNGSTHEASIDGLAGIGVITGTGGFSFRPQAPVTRGAMAALIQRSSDLVVSEGHTTPPA